MTHLNYADAIALVGIAFAFAWAMRQIVSNDYRLNLLSEELDKYKAVVLKLTEENEQLKAIHLQLRSSELTQHLEKVNCERENYKLCKALEEIREDLEQDTTCESRECGCDDYEECLKCVKGIILDKISEVLK